MVKESRRERLLRWIKGGDPDKVPILFWLSLEVAAAYFGKDRDEVTLQEEIVAAKALGLQNVFGVGSPMLFNAASYTDELSYEVETGKLPDGSRRTTSTITCPAGEMTSVQESVSGQTSTWTKHFMSDPYSLPVYVNWIKESARTILDNRGRVRRDTVEQLKKSVAETNDEGVSIMWVYHPLVELTSSWYFPQEKGIYFIVDEERILSELCELQFEVTKLWIECGKEAGVDVFGYAINGLEIYSPQIYDRWMVKCAAQMNRLITEAGKISWLHCCGKMDLLIREGYYKKMGPSVLESLSPPPLGDIADLAAARSALGDITTRGALSVGTLFSGSYQQVYHEAKRIISVTRGFRHMIGGTDRLLPGQNLENIRAVIDAVNDCGVAFDDT